MYRLKISSNMSSIHCLQLEKEYLYKLFFFRINLIKGLFQTLIILFYNPQNLSQK
jgi:hypothetical protein